MGTNTLSDYLVIDDRGQARLQEVYARYRRLYEDPEHCSPMFIVDTPVRGLPDWEARLADPVLMLKSALDILRPHLAVEDDRVPTVRVEFGTAQIPAAFGCDLAVPTNSLPAAATHILREARDVFTLAKPSLEAGWYGKLRAYTEVYQENLPAGVHIQHPDIQSPFNNAHLIRGNDILTDFYDDPEAAEALLDLVTDYMIDLVPHLKQMISDDTEWFFDWGALWKGAARISNCSMHMISPQFYRDHVLPRDIRLMRAIGGGRIHYCGTSGEVIRDFFRNAEITGLDYDTQYHDLWALSEIAPRQVVLQQTVTVGSPLWNRLLAGDWPAKRNLVLAFWAESIEEGKSLLAQIKASAPGGVE